MRRRNWRVILTGFVLIVLALGFYLFILTVASQSTDPVEFMQTMGTVSGVLAGISIAMIIMGLVGKKI
jgi:hypothetical protein